MLKDLSQTVGACPGCRSTLYSQTENGFLVCEHGHQSQSWWQEEQDDFDATVSRRRKISRKRQRPLFPGGSQRTDDGDDLFWMGDGRREYLEAARIIIGRQAECLEVYFGAEKGKVGKSVDFYWSALVGDVGDEDAFEEDDDEEEEDEPEHASLENTIAENSPDNILALSFSSSPTRDHKQQISSTPQEKEQYFTKSSSKLPSLRTLLIILYLSAHKTGLPLTWLQLLSLTLQMAANDDKKASRRLLPLPYFNTKPLLPLPLLKRLEKCKIDILLKHPSKLLDPIEMEAESFRLLKKCLPSPSVAVTIESIPLIEYFCGQLGIPTELAPLILKLHAFFKLPHSYDPANNAKHLVSPVVALFCSCIQFIRVHWAPELSREQVGIIARLRKLNKRNAVPLPFLSELKCRWRERNSAACPTLNHYETYKMINAIAKDDARKEVSFLWSDLDGILGVCAAMNIVNTEETADKADDPSECDDDDFGMDIFAAAAAAADVDVDVDDPQPPTVPFVFSLPKYWTFYWRPLDCSDGCSGGKVACSEAYSLLLETSMSILAVDPLYVARLIHKYYESPFCRK